MCSPQSFFVILHCSFCRSRHFSFLSCFFFFFNDTATTEIYTLSLHDALPISGAPCVWPRPCRRAPAPTLPRRRLPPRSEEHTSELQSRLHLVCRLLLEKKKKKKQPIATIKQHTKETE